MMFTYELMKSGEENQVIDIVLSTFHEFVAPQLSDEGIAEFLRFANAKALAERNKTNNFTVIAKQNNNPVGVIEIRDFDHICLFFIRKHYQKMGIGKNLLKYAIDICLSKHSEFKNLTVNSSLNAVKAYEKMGFRIESSEQCINGIRFVPMTFTCD